MVHVRSVRYVTENYAQLQGLRLVPLGLVFLISAAWRIGWLRRWPGATGPGATYWFVAMTALALLASFPIRSWYHRRFGVVRPRPFENGAITLITFTLLLLALVWVEEQLSSPLPLARIFFIGTLVYIGTAQRGMRPHYLVIATACVIVAVWRPLDLPLVEREILTDLLSGLALLVAGIGDHLVVIRALEP